jgi:hypothetical protein
MTVFYETLLFIGLFMGIGAQAITEPLPAEKAPSPTPSYSFRPVIPNTVQKVM